MDFFFVRSMSNVAFMVLPTCRWRSLTVESSPFAATPGRCCLLWAMGPGAVVARPLPTSSAEEVAILSVVCRGESLLSAGWTTLSECCSIAKLHQASHVGQLDLTGNQVSASSAPTAPSSGKPQPNFPPTTGYH